MVDRRTLISASGAAATLGALAFRPDAARAKGADPALPDPALYDRDEEAFWTKLRRQFLIPPDTVYLNNGTVGSSPRPVLKALFAAYEATEQMTQADSEDYPIWGYGPWNEYRDPLARFVGCARDEIALLRNATEANNYIANGIDLKAGDEVLITDQEHPSGEQPWNLRAKRHGVVVKKVALPAPIQDAQSVVQLYADAITPRTRVMFFSHVTTVTGTVLPAKELCALAREKGVLSAVDGAHAPGMMRFDISDIGCDMYAASTHKWLHAPKGTGFLFVRDEVIDRLWTTIATGGWDDASLRADRFQRIGSSNVPSLAGLKAAIELAEAVGMDRIEKRQREMADYLHDEMMKRGAQSLTSRDPALRCAIACVNVPGVMRMELQNWLWANKKIRIRGGEPSRLRLSAPYYLLRADIDRFLAAFDEFRAV